MSLSFLEHPSLGVASGPVSGVVLVFVLQPGHVAEDLRQTGETDGCHDAHVRCQYLLPRVPAEEPDCRCSRTTRPARCG